MKKYRGFLYVFLLLAMLMVPFNVAESNIQNKVLADEIIDSSKLSSLVVTGFENNLDPEFNSETTTYNLSLPSSIIDLDIETETISSGAEVSVSGNLYLKNNTGSITITVTNPNATAPTTYTINYTKESSSDTTEYTFTSTKDVQTFTTTKTGLYKFELWGAQGGHLRNTYNNGGGYTKGEIYLSSGTELYVYVGEAGAISTTGTFNGGGAGGIGSTNGFSGGGATDVRLIKGTNWNDADSLASRIMVAGGGGGASGNSNYDTAGGKSAAGGLISYTGGYYTEHQSEYVVDDVTYYIYGGAANQTSGGAGGINHYSATGDNESGSFGIGGNSNSTSGSRGSGGGGGGYYGGGAGGGTGESGYGQGGGGGTSYISGHAGSIAITAVDDLTPRNDSNNNICTDGTTDVKCSYHYSGYKFTNTIMIDGKGYNWTTEIGEQVGTPKTTGTGTYNGNRDDGYAKITLLSTTSDDNYLTNITSSDGTFTQTFDPLTSTYTLTLSAYTAKFTLDGTTSDPYASVQGFGEYSINLGETKRIDILVTSTSGNTKIYKVIATRSESELTTSSTKLKSLTFGGGTYTLDFEPLKYEYEIDVPLNTIDLSVEAVTFDEGASTKVSGNEYMKNSTGTIKVVVSKDGLEDTTYKIKYNKTLPDPDLSDLTQTFSYTGNYQTFTAPYSTEYRIELWGAEGGCYENNGCGQEGAYVAGTITLSRGTRLYVYVGQGLASINNAAFNATTSSTGGGNPGGGATDVRLIPGTWNDTYSLNSRIMVAGGGGSGQDGDWGGAAGGLIGYSSSRSGYTNTGGTQTGPGVGQENPTGCATGSFGIGSTCGATGGGGYYGGGGASHIYGSGSGGSSYISGHTGAVAITSEVDRTPKDGCTTGTTDIECSYHYSGYTFTDTTMIDGLGYNWTNEVGEYVGMPTWNGESTMTGNTGHGYAKIAVVSLSDDNYLTDISTNIGTWDKTFNPTTYVYNISLDKYEQKVTVSGVTSDKNAVISNLGEYKIKAGETKVVNLLVTAPSGKIKTYTLNITREALVEGEHNSKLAELEIEGIKLDPIFTSLTTEYNIMFSKNIYDLNITATPYDSDATVTITGDKYITDDYNAITIKVDAPSVESTTYKIYYTKLDYGTVMYEYGYTGEYETFVAPYYANYKIELWGAKGSYSSGNNGAYTSGNIYLTSGTTLYVYVGNKTDGMAGGWNGGGNAIRSDGFGGGGATDVRLTPTSSLTTWNEINSLTSRIMVAAGGGGAISWAGGAQGGYGGALVGGSGANRVSGGSANTPATGGTQTTGGTTVRNGSGAMYSTSNVGGFGYGASVTNGSGTNYGGGAGGGGYWGGASGNDYSGSLNSGAGGSSYISGYLGSVAVKSNTNYLPRLDSLGNICANGTTDIVCSYHYSGYVFTDGEMIAGNALMPNYTGTDRMTGNASNGFAKISIVDVESQNDYLDDLIFKKLDYSDDYLVDLGFEPTKNNYTVTLDEYTRAFELSGELGDENARVTGLGTYTIEPGESKDINIIVTAVDGNSRTYKVTVNRKTMEDHTALLKNLQVDKYNLNEAFYSKKYDYTVNIYDVEIDLVINASTFDSDAVVTVSGNTYINSNTGVVTVRVKHVGLEDEVYTITYTKVTPSMDNVTFNYTGEYQTWTAPFSAKYKIEAWGAAGGGGAINNHTSASSGGLGGYAEATFKILEGTNLYIYAGGKGSYGSGSSSYGGAVGGWNGGGNGGNSGSGSGGGATDVRMTPTSAKNVWNELNSLYSRIIVAGGAGGTDDSGGTYNGSNDGSGGSGSGLNGMGAWIDGTYYASYGGTQSNGYALGEGGSATTNTDTGGAGGGYYGGTVTNHSNGGAGAGSSYIKGYPGADTTYISYQDGAEYMEGSFKEAQNSGNGYVTISMLGIISDNIYLTDLTVTTDLITDSLIEETFDPQSGKYTAYLDKYSELFYVKGTLSDSNSKVTGLGEYRIEPGETKDIEVTVTAESGKTKTYTITVSRDDFEDGEHSTKLKSLYEETYSLRENFYSEKYDYRVNVYGNEIDTVWHYTTYDPEAQVTIEGDKYLKGHNVITFTVTLPEEYGVDPTVYEVVFTKVVTTEPSKNDYLKELKSSAGTLSPEYDVLNQTYKVTLSSTETGTRLTGKLDEGNAYATGLDKFYTVEPGQTRNVEIIVTSDYGTTRTYTVEIERASYDDSVASTKLKSLVISEYETDIDFQSEVYEYDIVLPKGEIDLTINAIPYDSDAIVAIQNDKHLVADEGTVTITVTKAGVEDTVYKINYTKYDEYSEDFDYTGEYQTFVAPYTGKYTFELWGAQGGTGYYSTQPTPGLGAYTKGTITLEKGTTLYIYVGGKGGNSANGSSIPTGGYNGGGNGTTDDSRGDSGGAGGGASDIRYYINTTGVWNNSKSLATRIMVAGGGGGSHSTNTTNNTEAMNAGALEVTGQISTWTTGWTPIVNQTTGNAFGYGITGESYIYCHAMAGGGGGYYGGVNFVDSSNCSGRASGGSSYISGYLGSVAITSINDTTPRLDSNEEQCISGTEDIECSYHYSGYIFTDTVMKSGNAEQPTHDGTSTQTGNSGNGYAKVSMELSQDAYLNNLETDYGVWNVNFNPLQLDYDLHLSEYEAYVNLTGELSNPNATVTGLDRMYELALGETKIVPVVVTAPNGDTKTYTITMHRDDYTDEHSSKLSLLNVIKYEEGYLDPKFTPINNNYTISIDSSEAEIYIDYETFDPTATVTVTGTGRIIGESGVIKVKVSASGVEDTTYTISYVLESIPEGTEFTFPFTGDVQEFIVPTTGYYQLEVWGAQGGGRDTTTFNNGQLGYGGAGGYSTGTIKLYKDQVLYVYVGGRGTPSNSGLAAGGFNGGGSSWASDSGDPAAGGGGATDIRTGLNDLYTRFIVAGGGGGGGEDAETGGIGGGINGGNGGSDCYGTQTTGRCGAIFGTGASTPYDGGGGGGGWYGGGTAGGSQTIPTGNSGSDTSGGSGGSGFVLTSETVSNTPNGYKLGEEWYLEDAKTVAGNGVMPTTDHFTIMYGKGGDGYAVITLLEKVSRDNYLVDLKSDYGTLTPTFGSDIENYTLSLDAYTPNFTLSGKASNAKATVTGFDTYSIEPGETKVINIVVTSTSGDTRTYKVTATRDNFTDTHSSLLSSLKINDGLEYELKPIFNSKVYEYNIKVYYNLADLDIVTDVYDDDAKVTITGNKHLSDSGVITITVNCEVAGETVYKINYTRDKSLEGYIPTDKDVVNTYDYTGNYQTFIAPDNGDYIIELWGAQGNYANRGRSYGGAGAYTYGIINLQKDQKLYVYVGENRTDRNASWNAGTTGGSGNDTANGGSTNGYGGGGATDIRLTPGSWNDLASLKSRIMVAAGGGGGSDYAYPANGGAAGALVGFDGANGKYPNVGIPNVPPTGATQTSGGKTSVISASGGTGANGGFGTGGNGNGDWGSGGGGGYFNGGGGGYTSNSVDSGAGGSSYISGYTGSIAIASADVTTPRNDQAGALCANGTTDITCSYHYSGKIFTNTVMLSGEDVIPSKTGTGTSVGNTGSGYAKIIQILKDEDNYLETLTSTYGTFDKTYDPLVTEYTLTLDQYDTSFTLEGTLSNDDATVTGLGYYEIEVGETKEIQIVVTAESGDTKTYTVTAIRNPFTDSHSTKLKSLRLLDNEGIASPYGLNEEFNSLKYNYTANLYYNVIDLTVNAVPYDPAATVEILDNLYLIDDDGRITVKVTAPDTDPTYYYIDYHKDEDVDVEDEYDYDYTGQYQTFIAPYTGKYLFQAWGAEGGTNGGKGAYTDGVIALDRDQLIYIYVGGRGATGCITATGGGWNGGGNPSATGCSSSGGGATDFRLIKASETKTVWNEITSLRSRIMVAAGAGAGESSVGGAGGTINGTTAYNGTYATQTSGSAFGYCPQPTYDASAGGGGYWGGTWPGRDAYHGGGGSSYISGYLGTVAVISKDDTSPRLDKNGNACTNESALNDITCSYHYSGLTFENSQMIAGNAIMPTIDGTDTMTGKSGNGYAKITPLFYSRDYYLTNITATSELGNTMFPVFDPLTDTYSVTIDKYDEWVTIDAELSDPTNSVVAGTGEYRLENPGDEKTVELVVTAQSGETKTYTVYVRRNEFDTHTTKLKDLDIIGSEDLIDPRFHSLNYEYDIILSSGVIDASIGYAKYDSEAIVTITTLEEKNKVVGDDIYYLKDDEGTIIITVTLPDEYVDPNNEDTQPTTYIIRYNKNLATGNDYSYTGKYQTWVAPTTGYYKFELWGASGGSAFGTYASSNVNYGGYTSGTMNLPSGTTLYVYVGSAGQGVGSGYAYGGWNGGGNNYTSCNTSTAGGGASDIRVVNTSELTIWNEFDSLKSRIMVAGAAGGRGGFGVGGSAGGLESYSGTYNSTGNGHRHSNQSAATQTSGGKSDNHSNAYGEGWPINTDGSFGYGGTGSGGGCMGSGGGGGYYGGAGAYNSGAGSGGSSYISGHNGSNSVAEESTVDNIIHTGSSEHYSGYVFTDTVMIDGQGYNWTNVKEEQVEMPNPSGGTYALGRGQDGNGYARITPLDEDNYLLSLTVTIDKKFKTDDFDNVEGAKFTPTFDKFTNTYTLELPDHVTDLTIGARPSSDTATIEGIGNHEVLAGENIYEVVVTAESGEERVYTIKVTRPASKESRALDISVTGFVETLCKPFESQGYCKLTPASYDPDNTDYYLKVPSGIRDLEWTATKMHEYQKITGAGITRLGPWLNLITIEVQAESCAYLSEGETCEDITDYTYHVTRDMTGDNYIDELIIYDPDIDIGFDYLLSEYSFRVENQYTELGMTVVLDDPNASYEIIGNENFEVGSNIVEIIVTAENGEKRTYVLNVYRLANSNKLLSELHVKNSGNEYTLTPPFEDIITSYALDVPNEIDNIDITATAAYNKTSISGTGNHTLKTGLNEIHVVTTAENGETETYTIVVNRAKSDNAYLKSLSAAEGNFNETYVKTNNNYTMTVNPYVKKLDITAIVEEENATYKITGNDNFKIGPNVVNIVVTAENGNRNTYTITVTKEGSEINTLKSLETNRGDLTPTFNPNTNNYTITVPNDITDITVAGEMTDILSKVTGFGTYRLTTGENIIAITVTSETGVPNTYTITVFREYNSNHYLASLTVNNGTLTPDFDKETSEYRVNVSNDVENIVITGIPEVSTTTVTGNGTKTLVPGENEFIITATAEDGSSKEYKVIVTRDKSSNANLDSLTIQESRINPTFNPMITSYTAKVLYDIEDVHVIAIPSDPEATVSVVGNTNLSVGDNTVTVTVTAPDGTEKEYEITVKRLSEEESPDLYLASLTVSSCTIDFNKKTYYYECVLNNEISEVEIEATPEDLGDTVLGTGTLNLSVGDNIRQVVVKNGGFERVYTIKVTRLKSTESRLKDLIVKDHTLDPEFNSDTLTYNLTTKEYELEFEFVKLHDGETIEVIGNDNLALGNNVITIRVTSEDGAHQTEYVLNVERTVRDDNYLSNLWVEDETISPEFNKLVNNYKVFVPYETTSVIIGAEAEDRNATVEGTGMKMVIPGPNTFTVRVKAEDNSVREYRITVTRAASPNNYLESLTIDGEVYTPEFNRETLTYTLTVPYETDTLNIEAIPEDEEATVLGDGVVSLKQGVNNIEIYVTAPNGNVRTYVVKVTRKDPITAKLLNIEVENYTLEPEFKPDDQLYQVTVDYETTKLNFIITKMDPYSTYEIVGNRNFKIGLNDVYINVTASNRVDTFQYHVVVNRQAYSNTFLSYLTVNQGELSPEFEKTTLTYNVEVPNNVASITLDGAPDYPLSTVTGLGDYTLNVGVNTIKVVVTSPSGIKRTYTVNVNRRKSSNANLESIKSNIGTLTKDDEYTYTLVVPKYTTNIGRANFTVTTEDPQATVSMPVTIDLTQTTAYPIRVTSPDGTRTKEYTVNVEFDLSHDATLASLIPSVGELNPKFDPKTNNYRIDLFDDEEEEYFDLYLNEVEATLLNRSLTYQLTELETTAEIMIQAEDGTINTYTILIAKSKTKEKYLDNIVITGVTEVDPSIVLPSFRSKTFDYTLDVPYEVAKIGFDITKRHPSQQIKIYNNDVLQSGDSYALTVGVNNFRIEVTNSLGEVTNYNYVITRATSTNANLKVLGLTDPEIVFEGFNKDLLEYDAQVPYEYENVVINAIPEEEGARVTINGATYLVADEERTVTIKVTAPDGKTTKTYKINILREPEVNNLLKTLTLSSGRIQTLNPKFRPGHNDYTLTVSSTTANLQVDALPQLETTVVTGDLGLVPVATGENVIKIYSTATYEGKEYTRTYTINVTRSSADNALLESLEVFNGTMVEPFDKTRENYTINVENDVTSLDLKYKPEDEAATVTITGNENLGYGNENLVTIKVRSANGNVVKNYFLHVVVKGESNPYLKDLQIDGVTVDKFDKYIEEYNITVENAVNDIDVLGIPESDNSTVISGNGMHALTIGENSFDITVEAQDGETRKTYTINVTREENAYLMGIVTDRGGAITDFDKSTYEYELTVENDIEDITIIGWASDMNAEVTGNGKYLLDVGDNPIYLTVKNGTTRKVYTVNVKRKGSSNTNLLYLTSTDGDLDPLFSNDIDNYEMHLPNYKTKLALAYAPEHNATVQVINNNLSGTESTVQLLVTAEDGTTRTINIKVYLEDGGYFNSRLASLSVAEGAISPKFDPDTHSYTLTVNQDVEKIHITAVPEETNSVVTGDGEVEIELGRNEQHVVVTAEDGTTTTYTLIVFRKDMDNADLTGLYTDIGELNPEFNPKIYEYEIDVPEETRKVHLTAVAYSEKTIEGDGDVYLQKGTTIRNIIVTSESGISNTYVVKINRALSTNHDIINITESTGEMSPIFNQSTLDYGFKVGDVKPNLDKTYVVTNHVEFDVTTYSELAEVIYEKEVTSTDEDGNEVVERVTLPNNDVSLDYGNNKIIIYAMSEDGNTSDEYVFNIYRIHDLTNITVPGDATGPNMEDGSPNHISVQPGGTFDLLAEIGYTPEDADFKDLIFKSNNTSFVTVDANGIITAADVLDKSTTITVTSKYYPNIVKTVNVTVEITLITSEVHDIQRESTKYDPYITFIELKTSIQDFLDNLDNDNRFLHVYGLDGVEIKDYTKFVGTGMKVTLENNGHTYDSLDIVVKGDIDGDGYSIANDIAKIKSHILKKSTLEGVEFLAADIDDDGYVVANDQAKVKSYVLKRISSYIN